MRHLYRNVVLQRYIIEKQALRTSLSLAILPSDQFAYDLMKGPGYMAVVSEEVVHMIKCIPVEVTLNHGTVCYAELQVNAGNKTYFSTPRTHILKSTGTQISCHRAIPVYFKVDGLWVKIVNGHPEEGSEPGTIGPITKGDWAYKDAHKLASTGLYTDAELNSLKNRIMFPVERPAVLSDLALEIQGHPIAHTGGAIFKLLNEDMVKKLADTTWNRMWNRFMTFGSVSAGVLAMFIILRVFTRRSFLRRKYDIRDIDKK